MRVTPLYDGTLFTAPELIYCMADQHYPVVPGAHGLSADDWREHPAALTEGHLELTFGGYLVEPGDGRVVLVDAGQEGRDRLAPAPEVAPQAYGHLINSMREAGVEPDDVTDVVITLPARGPPRVGCDGRTADVRERDVPLPQPTTWRCSCPATRWPPAR